MDFKKKKIIINTILLLFFSIICDLYGQSDSQKKGGPLPAVSVEGLPKFLKLLAFSSRNIAEGDFEEAILILKKAERIHPNDPRLLEYFGLAYDGDRDPKKAFSYFIRAGHEYFKLDNIQKSWRMIGWLRTINSKSKEVINFEKKVRKRQLELNEKKNLEKK